MPTPGVTPSSNSISLETLTLLGRLRSTRAVAVFVVLCVLAPLVWAYAVRSAAIDLGAVDIGLDVQRHAYSLARVGNVDARWPGVQQGDLVISLNGQAVPDASAFPDLRRSLAEGPVTVVFERGGQRFERTANTSPRTVEYRLGISTRLLSAALLFLLGLSAFLLRPGTRLSWVFLGFCYCIGLLAMIVAGITVPMAVAFIVGLPLVCAATSIGANLFFVFPRRSRLLERAPWLVAAVYAFSALLGATYLYGQLILRDPQGLLLWAETAVRLWGVLFGLSVFALLVFERRRARREGEDRLVSQYDILLIGVAAGLLIPLITTAVLRIAHLDGSSLSELAMGSTVIFAGLTAWTLVRHNPLDVDRYAGSVVGYTLTLGLLGVVFAGVVAAMPLALSALGLAHSSEALVGATAAVVLTFGPLYRVMKKRVDVWFSREQADVLQTSRALRELAEKVQSQTRDQALLSTLETALVLQTDVAQLWLLDTDGVAFERALPVAGTAQRFDRQSALGAALLKGHGGVAALAPVAFAVPAQQELWSLELAMAVPVRAHGALVGFLSVGRKRSGFAWREEELSFLGTVGAQTGAVLERSEVLARIGRYRVEKRLAVGGMAEVFLAWQMGEGGFERKVALKRLLPDLAEDPRFTAMLLDEARIASRLSHRNIAQVLDVGREGDQYFIAMEFVDGPPIRKLLSWASRQDTHVPVPIVLAIADSMLAALEYAHRLRDERGEPLNIVHRDVTPANVLLTLRGEVKLVDFGLARATTKQFRTETGVVRGTLPYMSLEQASQGAVDLRTDLYAAGCTLYELFTRTRAFPQGPTADVPPAPSTLRPGLPTKLDGALLKAVAAEASARWASAALMRGALLDAFEPQKPATEEETARWLAHALSELPEEPAAGTVKPSLAADDKTATRKLAPP